MTFQEFIKETKKLTTIFALAAGVTTGGVIGGGVIYHEYHEPAAKVEYVSKDPGTTRLKVPSDYRTVVEAEVIQVSGDGSLVVRAHPWVGQYMLASVTQADAANALDAKYTANITNEKGDKISSAKKGDVVYLRGLKGKGLDGVSVEIPNVKPTGDVVAGPVQAKVIRVIDGDTPAVIAQIWPGNYVSISIRVDGIDTPEKKGRAKNEYEAELAEKASAATRALIEGKDVVLYNIEYEKFGGRVLGDVKTLDGVDIAQNLISKGLAREYHGEAKQPWVTPKGFVPQDEPAKPVHKTTHKRNP